MSVVFAVVAPHSPSLEYEISRVDGAPGTHVPECRVCTVRAYVVVIEHPHTISSSSLMRQTSSRADGVPFVAVALLRRCAGQDVQDEGPRDVNAGRAPSVIVRVTVGKPRAAIGSTGIVPILRIFTRRKGTWVRKLNNPGHHLRIM